MNNNLKQLIELQKIDSRLLSIEELRGDLPNTVVNLAEKLDKTKVGTIHLEKMKKWKYNKNTGVISHESKQFFKVEGKRVTNAKREINRWDQPFLTQVGYKGGIIGLVRCFIKNIPHYLIDA